MKSSLPEFLKSVRFGYLAFTTFLIILLLFGFFEIIEVVLFSNANLSKLKWLHLSRGIITAFVVLLWAAWTIYQYRGLYKSKLETTRVRYSEMLEQASDAIITTSNKNTITAWNKGAENLFGYTAEKAIGLHISFIIPQNLIDQGELKCLKHGLKNNGFVSHYETERINKEGKKILVDLSETEIKDANGQVIGSTQILRDVSEKRIKEKQFQQSERLASVGHMAAGVAHEIGNPLASISSLTQLLQRKTDDPFSQNQLAKIREQINRINTIVRDLVDFSRPSSEEATDTNVNEIIKSATGLLKHDARCRDIEFILNMDKDMASIKIVPDQLHQVIVNILLNAADALKEIKEPKILIRTQNQKNNVIIRICDNGSGIPEEIKDRIFEPFFTTKDTGSGTGLGLSVSHGIIKSMNGNIELGSKEGFGTCFKIIIPKK